MSGILNDTITYLAGPIDRVKDHGRGWRKEFTEVAKTLGIQILDPTKKPSNKYSETSKEKQNVQNLKDEGKWDELTQFVKTFRRLDLRFVDLTDFLVVYIDPDVHMVGTWHEVIEASKQHKPIFAITKGGKARMSAWTFSLIDWRNMFDDMPSLLEHLKKIDNGEVELNDKWVLVRDHLSECAESLAT